MPAKQKPNETIIKALKDKYFLLATKENLGQTPDITKEIEELEVAIKNLTGKTVKKK